MIHNIAELADEMTYNDIEFMRSLPKRIPTITPLMASLETMGLVVSTVTENGRGVLMANITTVGEQVLEYTTGEGFMDRLFKKQE